MTDYKQQVILDNITGRENEIALYDINITNYEHAIKAAEGEAGMEEFVQRLRDLLVSERRERRKAELILNALRSQQV